jgi:membrane protease YdiL (CAAX protease family)
LGLCLLLVGLAWRGEVGKVNQGTPAGMTSAISLIIGIVCFHGTFLALLWAYFSVLRRKSPSDVFGLQSLPLGRTLRLAVLCLLPAALLAIWLNLLSSFWLDMLGVVPREQEAVQILRGASGFSMQLAVALAACVGAPLQEEFLFRGLLYGSLKRYSGTALALISSSLLFGAIHMNLAAFLPLTILGFCFALAYEISGCLWVSILMHALFNLGMTIAAIYA